MEYTWYRIVHLIGMVLWVSGIAATLALLGSAPHIAASFKEAFIAKLRRVAIAMDLGATLVIAVGLVMAFSKVRWPTQNAFTTGGWLHAKLFLVAIGVLAPHLVLRLRIARLRKSPTSDAPLPAWLAPLFIFACIAIIALVANPTLMRK